MDLRAELKIGERVLTIETGRMAKQAGGSALVRYGDTMVLVTACAQPKPVPNVSFLPLTVDYKEATYAAGKIPGGFFRREGRPTEKEILTARMIDRPIRPLFPPGYYRETQVVGLVLSADTDNDPDILAVTGASTALYLSAIPFHTPIAAVRVGLIGDDFVINPTHEQLDESRLDLVVVGSKNALVMVEAGAHEVPRATVVEAIYAGHEKIVEIVALQEELFRQAGVVKDEVEKGPDTTALKEELKRRVSAELDQALVIRSKKEREKTVFKLEAALLESWPEEKEDELPILKTLFHELIEEKVRGWILEDKTRPDGRAFDEVRAITCEVGLLPRTHGSALFTRGETQALATVTLGTAQDAQRIEALEGEGEQRFLLHYNFPPFSVGEVKFMRGPGRREIGHGALARRALESLIPAELTFPYTIRVVSDILESNGSSSMATVCGGSLALMDAGVPMKDPVAGVAMGLVKEGDRVAVLTDIAGYEDHYGDMDFKVAGTRNGVTALQMDIKIEGITRDIVERALEQADAARLQILDKMNAVIGVPRDTISVYAPRIISFHISKDKIRDVIGPGGKMIRSIIERTGVKIDIDDDGKVDIASANEAALQFAMDIIKELVAEAESGKVYLGKVQKVMESYAFIEILPGTDGMLHISEVADYHVRDIHEFMKEGDDILVKVINIDGQNRIKLSRKALVKEGLITDTPPPDSDRGDRGDRGRRPFDGDRHRRPFDGDRNRRPRRD
jgi:polyribonucleotide nucleotidyltransferase